MASDSSVVPNIRSCKLPSQRLLKCTLIPASTGAHCTTSDIVAKAKHARHHSTENLQPALQLIGNMATSILRYLIRELQQVMKAADAKVIVTTILQILYKQVQFIQSTSGVTNSDYKSTLMSMSVAAFRQHARSNRT